MSNTDLSGWVILQLLSAQYNGHVTGLAECEIALHKNIIKWDTQQSKENATNAYKSL